MNTRSKPQVVKTPQEMIELRKAWAAIAPDKEIGFVPTMGALHQGHASLLKASRQENDYVVLSIFVNPTQFNNTEDLAKYPKTFEHDLALAESCQVDAVFAPEFAMMYPDQYRYKVSENEFSKILCGTHRPGHFDGVLSVVLKLLQIVKPHRAYFGLKDYQQFHLIKDMCASFFLDLEIKGLPTVREDSGLALSSRNTRLSAEGLQKASLIFKTLEKKLSLEESKQILRQEGFDIDYLEDHFNRRFVAASLEGVRLIDNVEL